MTRRLPQHLKKIADKGSTERFLREHVNHDGQDCLIWPYARNAAGYGLAVVGGKQSLASRWMCVLAHGNPDDPKHEAAHSCGNGNLGCVNPRHIRWASHRENMSDTLIHGTRNRGERNGKTTITEQDVRDIRDATPPLKKLAEKYGLTVHGITKIRSGSRWGHVT